MKEKEKERIKYQIELLRLSALGLLTIGGGVVSLILDRPFSGGKSFFVAFGMVLLVLLGAILFKTFYKIKQTLK